MPEPCETNTLVANNSERVANNSHRTPDKTGHHREGGQAFPDKLQWFGLKAQCCRPPQSRVKRGRDNPFLTKEGERSVICAPARSSMESQQNKDQRSECEFSSATN